MNHQSLTSGQTNKPIDSFQRDSFREKRHIELKRRFSLLQHKRSQLERELHTIKTLLVSLDRQMQSYSDYQQLSINS
tara:strand:- start:120 stop:350 length:231 start_codon:yes stop_codon:yes gene_type:complete